MEWHYYSRNDLIAKWMKIVLAFVMVLLSLYIYRCISALNRSFRHLPGFGVENPISNYLAYLSHCYKTRKDMSPLTYLFQIVCGICYMYRNQKICFMVVAFRPYVMLYKAETVEAVLSSNVAIEKSKEYNLLHSWLGTGLLTSTGDKWRTRRKLLTSSFHFRILEDFIPIYNEQSKVLLEKMRVMANKEWVDVVPLITMCTLEIICETTMGVRLNAQELTNSEYVAAIYEVGSVFVYRSLRPWLWSDTLFGLFPSGRKFKKNLNILHDFTRKVIKEKKKILLDQMMNNVQNGESKSHENGFDAEQTQVRKKRRALLELLLEHHLKDETLTEEDIREEVDTFMFEGHDTTTMAICWVLYNLGLRPDVQEKVFEELDSIFEDDIDRPVTSEDMKAMKYLDCVIKESLRLYPSVPIIARELKEDLQILQDELFKKLDALLLIIKNWTVDSIAITTSVNRTSITKRALSIAYHIQLPMINHPVVNAFTQTPLVYTSFDRGWREFGSDAGRHAIQVDYTIPPGYMCFIFPYMLHRDSDTFPNPEYFDPERFTTENAAGRHPYAYVPFSAGPRNCIGQRFAAMEEKTILAHILRNFKLKSLDHKDRVQVIPDLVLRNNSPIRIQLIPRNQ